MSMPPDVIGLRATGFGAQGSAMRAQALLFGNDDLAGFFINYQLFESISLDFSCDHAGFVH